MTVGITISYNRRETFTRLQCFGCLYKYSTILESEFFSVNRQKFELQLYNSLRICNNCDVHIYTANNLF